MAHKKAKKVLLEYGLTNKETDVYILLTKNGILTGGEISKRSKIARSLVYRILKSLQGNGLVEPTLESPTRFVAIPFDRALDLIINEKKQEVLKIEREKQELLEDWENISKIKPFVKPERFVIIEGSKKINLKFGQLLKETKKKFIGILTIPDLVRAEQFGVFDSAHNNPSKSKKKFQILTEVNNEELDAFELFKPKLNSEIELRARNPESPTIHLPRMVLKDNNEVMFFSSNECSELTRGQDDVCIYTNCESLVDTFNDIFQNLWSTSKVIDKRFLGLITGEVANLKKLPGKIPQKLQMDNWNISQKTLIENETTDYISAPKLHLLNSEERDFLDMASVVGEKFSSEIIEKITGSSKLTVMKTLINIESEYQLIHSDGNDYRFSSPKVRETLYNNIKPKLQILYHSLVAKYLEEINPDKLNDFVFELGNHYYYSKNASKAIPYLLKAGEKCRKQFKFSDSLDSYSKALEMIGNNSKWKKERSIAIENFADLSASMGNHEKANECYTKALNFHEDVADKERVHRKIRRKISIKKNGKKIQYSVYGKGKSTLLLLGYSTHFMPQIHYFSQKYKVVIIDLLGEEMWSLEDLPTEYTLKLFTEYIQGVVEDLKQSEKIYLVGTASGGTLAIKYVAENPGRIAKLTLLATPPRPPIFRKQFEEFWAEALESPYWGLKNFYNKVMAPFWPNSMSSVRSLMGIRSSCPIPPTVTLITFKLLVEADVRPFLEKIRIPTLILHGEKDVLPLEDVEYMKKRISSSKSYVFKDATFVSVTKPKEFNRVLEQFLNKGDVLKN